MGKRKGGDTESSKLNCKSNKTSSSNEHQTKRPFDKKQYRLKKYSNKYKVDKWKEMRSKKVLNEYEKVSKQNDKGINVQEIYEKYDNDSDLNETDPIDILFPKPGTSPKATVSKENTSVQSKRAIVTGPIKRKSKFEEIKEERERKREEYLKKKKEKEEALKIIRKQKAERSKKLNKRTKKGQPIMKDRLEMLFEQVQKICQEENKT